MLALSLDASQISQASFCPLSWYLRYRENLAPTGEKREALDKGTIFHMYLGEYYLAKAEGFTYDEACQRTVVKFKDNQEIKKLDPTGEYNQALSQRFLQYVMRYSQNDLRAIKKDGTSAVEIGFSVKIYEDSEFTFIIEGRIDLIGEIEKTLFVDHKTQGRKSNLYKYKPQFLTYALATGLEYGLINYIGMTKECTNDTFRRALIHFPPWKIAEWRKYIIERVFWPIGVKLKKFQYIRENCKDPQLLEFTQSEERALFELDKRLTSCSGAFDSNSCMYAPLCETNDVQMIKTIKAFQYEKISPWSPWDEE